MTTPTSQNPESNVAAKSSRVSTAVLWALLGIAIAVSILWTRPLQDASERIASLPVSGMFYTSQNVPLSDAEKQFFGKAGVTRRMVSLRGQVFLLTVVDGTGDRHSVHDPLYCFRGAGNTIVQQLSVSTDRGQVSQVIMTGPNGPMNALYWFSDGVQHHSEPWKYLLQTAWRRMTLGASGAEPILVILVPMNPAQQVDWAKVLEYWPEILKL